MWRRRPTVAKTSGISPKASFSKTREASMALILVIIALALLFDFLNGMNDAANSVATIVSTRVLSPKQAVLWAAFFNFIAVFFFGVHVATTIGQGIVVTSVITPPLLLVV